MGKSVVNGRGNMGAMVRTNCAGGGEDKGKGTDKDVRDNREQRCILKGEKR